MENFILLIAIFAFLPFLVSLGGRGGIWKFLAFLCSCLAVVGTVNVIGGIVAWILAWVFAAIALGARRKEDQLSRIGDQFAVNDAEMQRNIDAEMQRNIQRAGIGRNRWSELKIFNGRRILGILAFCLLLFFVFRSSDIPKSKAISDNPLPQIVSEIKPAQQPQRVASIDKSSKMQQGRKRLIEKFIGSGVFRKVATPGSLPRVYVGPAFYALDFDDKQAAVSVIYAYHFDGSNSSDLVRVMDSRTNKEIGIYALPPFGSGLKLN